MKLCINMYIYMAILSICFKSRANEILERCCFLLMLDVEAGSILLAIYISPSDTLIRFCDKMAKMLKNVFNISDVLYQSLEEGLFFQKQLRDIFDPSMGNISCECSSPYLLDQMGNQTLSFNYHGKGISFGNICGEIKKQNNI